LATKKEFALNLLEANIDFTIVNFATNSSTPFETNQFLAQNFGEKFAAFIFDGKATFYVFFWST
jgi:hypothetical protein